MRSRNWMMFRHNKTIIGGRIKSRMPQSETWGELHLSRNAGARTFLSEAMFVMKRRRGFSETGPGLGVAESEQHKSGPLCGLDRNVRAPARLTIHAAPTELGFQYGTRGYKHGAPDGAFLSVSFRSS